MQLQRSEPAESSTSDGASIGGMKQASDVPRRREGELERSKISVEVSRVFQFEEEVDEFALRIFASEKLKSETRDELDREDGGWPECDEKQRTCRRIDAQIETEVRCEGTILESCGCCGDCGDSSQALGVREKREG